jgi:hypothetical protein
MEDDMTMSNENTLPPDQCDRCRGPRERLGRYCAACREIMQAPKRKTPVPTFD